MLNRDEQAALIESHLCLARRAAGRMRRRAGRLAEPGALYCAALEGLWRAARAYDPGRGPFARYAARCVAGAVLEWLRQSRPWGRRRAGGVPLAAAGPRFVALDHHPAGRGPAPGQALADADDVRCALGCLSTRDARLVRLVYCDGLTQEAAGRALGLSGPRVAELLPQLRARMRARLEWAERRHPC